MPTVWAGVAALDARSAQRDEAREYVRALETYNRDLAQWAARREIAYRFRQDTFEDHKRFTAGLLMGSLSDEEERWRNLLNQAITQIEDNGEPTSRPSGRHTSRHWTIPTMRSTATTTRGSETACSPPARTYWRRCCSSQRQRLQVSPTTHPAQRSKYEKQLSPAIASQGQQGVNGSGGEPNARTLKRDPPLPRSIPARAGS